jgi:Ferredoxin
MMIHVTDFEGTTHVLPAEEGWPLMEVIRAGGIAIKAECGGCCLCSTCHVYVDPDWLDRVPAIGDEEEGTLGDAPELRETSRLSCQIPMSADLDGLRLTLAPTL